MSTKARVVAIALSLMAVGVCVAVVACLGSCVSAGYDSETTKTETVTKVAAQVLMAAGIATPIPASTTTTTSTTVKRKAHYDDTRQAGAMAGQALSWLGDSGILSQLPLAGWLSGGGIIGTLGVAFAKLLHSNAKLKGQSEGWDQHAQALGNPAGAPPPSA